MKSKTMILMGIAVVCGLGASYMTSRLLAERNETVTVYLPKQKYMPWTHIKDPQAMFEEKEIPKKDAPKSAVNSYDELKDRILLKSLPAGQPVVQEDLQPKDKASLDGLMPPGKRAIAIKTDATTTVGGFVLPGSHVDVLHASRFGDHTEAKVVLQNLLVRAVDLQTVRPEDKAGVVPATVTLEVTPEEAVILAKVKDTGVITLALRPVGDSNVNLLAAAPLPAVLPAAPPAAKKEEKPAAPEEDRPTRRTLTIFNGPQWIQANFVTHHGETNTEIQTGGQAVAAEAVATPAPAPAPKPAPKSSRQIVGEVEQAVRKAEKDLRNRKAAPAENPDEGDK